MTPSEPANIPQALWDAICEADAEHKRLRLRGEIESRIAAEHEHRLAIIRAGERFGFTEEMMVRR
ncbi:MAG TPA: hypothetical protein VJW93_07340, partial [Candidatus Acidoferrales bacterium]|nr:hypothetical protein [Candidatus Acidoferrales bacterium]